MKLSNIVAILILLQFIYLIGIVKEWYTAELGLSLQHEDMIGVVLMMTWFIVRAIENINKDKNV